MQSTNRDVLRLFVQHAKQYKFAFAGAVSASIVSNALELLPPWLYKLLLDELTAPESSLAEKADSAMIIILAIMATKLGFQVMMRAMEYAIIYLESHVMEDVVNTCFRYLERHSYQFFSNAFSGALVRKISRLASSLEILLDQYIFHLQPQIILTIGSVAIIWHQQPTIGAIMAAWVLIFLALNLGLFKILQKYTLARAAKDSEVTGTLADALSNNVNVKLFARYSHEETRYAKVMHEWQVLTAKGWTMHMIPSFLGGLSFVAVEFAVMRTALHYYEAGSLTVGDFAMFQGYIVVLISRLWQLQRVLKQTFQALSDSREMVDILKEPHEVQDARRAKPLAVSRGAIGFSDVKFSYNQTRTVLKDFNLNIEAGEHVALVGPSGSGKSTVVKLLFRFYDLDKGKILIDGQKISGVTQESLRDQVSLVPQDPSLFHRSLKENIRYGKLDATDEEVVEAAKKAHSHDFISSLSQGYDTLVGERGIKLSGGERQRVAIARAILKDAPILVLDEATSSLDSESEMLIQDALKTLMKGKTSIVIAHRLSTIMQMDRIIVMQDGRIIDQGTHQELLKRQGMYKKLWEIQAGGFI
jgi:ATP-binding cassette subfamily B protein